MSKKYFDTLDENLRIFIESEEDRGLLKIKDFPGAILTEGIIFPPLMLRKNQIHRTCR